MIMQVYETEMFIQGRPSDDTLLRDQIHIYRQNMRLIYFIPTDTKVGAKHPEN